MSKVGMAVPVTREKVVVILRVVGSATEYTNFREQHQQESVRAGVRVV